MFLLLLVQELSIFEPPEGVQLDEENLLSQELEPEQVEAAVTVTVKRIFAGQR